MRHVGWRDGRRFVGRLTMLLITAALGGIALPISAGTWDLSSPGLAAQIDLTTGSITRLRCLRHGSHDLLRSGGALHLVVADRQRGETATFSSVRASQWIRDGDKFGLAIRQELGEPQCSHLLSGRVEYGIDDDALYVRQEIFAKKHVDRPIDLSFGLEYDPSQWLDQKVADLWAGMVDLPIAETASYRYYGAPWDAWQPAPGTREGAAVLPVMVLEGPDDYLLAGALDVNTFLYITPNHLGMNPCFTLSTKELEPEQHYSFSLVFKLFPRDRYDFGDVCRWYLEHIWSSNPLTRGLVSLPPDHKPRVLSPGNVTGGFLLPQEYALPGQVLPPEQWAQAHDTGVRMKMLHLWYGMFSWDETYPVHGEWYMPNGLKLDPETFREEIRDLHRDGYKLYIYFRQLFPHLSYYDNRPKYKSWMLRTKPGTVFVCPSGPAPLDALPLGEPPFPDVVVHRYGLPSAKTSYIHADFCNDDFRQWYIAMVKRFLDAFPEVDGIAWDMGWDVHTAPCLAHPETGTHQGILRVQYEIAQYMRQRHPHMRAIMNMTVGSPSQRWVDGVMFEGGLQVTKTGADFVKNWRTPMVGYYYAWAYRTEYGDGWVDHYIHDMMRNLSYGVTWAGGDLTGWMNEPRITAMTELADLSARANSLPLVIEGQAIDVRPADPKITAAVWAGAGGLIVLVYNDSASPQEVEVRVQKDRLRQYGYAGLGPERIRVFDKDDLPRPGGPTKTAVLGRGDAMVVRTRLMPRELWAGED